MRIPASVPAKEMHISATMPLARRRAGVFCRLCRCCRRVYTAMYAEEIALQASLKNINEFVCFQQTLSQKPFEILLC